MAQNVFLSAQWQNLVMANYVVDPAILKPYLPYRTELDFYNGKCYVSLVGFLFGETRVRGVPIPFHTRFPEVNLRFYVKFKEDGEWKRGVVFVSEIVPKPAVTWVANAVYKERYIYMPMRWNHANANDLITAKYEWKYKNNWNVIEAVAANKPQPIAEGGKEEFIFEHYFGYSKMTEAKTGAYEVQHPRWEVYPIKSYHIKCRFAALYGPEFAMLEIATPASVFMAKGSAVKVLKKRIFI